MSGTNKWIEFFRDCGLPIAIATNYAIIFTKHRIQKNMIADITKEYLQEMGITVMGDVIAILKYAKLLTEKEAREKVLIPRGAVESINIKPSSPASRMVNHHIKNIKKVSMKSQKLKLEVPVPTKRRVLPEHEGGYIIKMPDGRVRRTQTANKKQTSVKKSVFNRLGGESVVSSTTDFDSFTSTKSSSDESSVFSRLGRSHNQDIISTSANDEMMVDDNNALSSNNLKYGGILKRKVVNRQGTVKRLVRRDGNASLIGTKTSTVRKRMQVNRNPTLQSDMLSTKSNIRNRITAPTTKITLSNRFKNNSSRNEKVSRLGGVFARLGPASDESSLR